MNNDIVPQRPPSRPQIVVPPRPQQVQGGPGQEATPPQSFPESNFASSVPNQPVAPIGDVPQEPASEPPINTPNPTRPKHMKWIIAVIAILVLGVVAVLGWYQLALRPPVSGDPTHIRVTITKGSSPSEIGALLEEKKIIRSKLAFDIYTRLKDTRNNLQAGTFSLSPAESTAQIVGHLMAGASEEYEVTFYPGATLNIKSTSADTTPSHRQALQKLGFSDDEITEAFNTSYAADYPVLFADKPASADLEGYIYGETYRVASGSTVKQILMRTFDEFEAQIKQENLVELYQQQGLTLYEGITLASIIQREVPNDDDQKQVAQIFFTRLHSGMMLGSDVTYHYAADIRGVPRTHTLDDPYNTRINAGLPPGPIASPGISSLRAGASPASGDYVYFLSGDDDKTYFATTNEEHEANIVNHCAYKCSLP